MASDMPIPEPPRTPTPPLDDEPFDTGSLPGTPRDQGRYGLGVMHEVSEHSEDDSPAQPALYASGQTLAPYDTSYSESQQSKQDGKRGPFGFQPQAYAPSGTNAPAAGSIRSNIGQRRGHKYKHSSISHQIFQEPTPKAPLRLPASLPVPTFKESYKSMTQAQRIQTAWCFCHLLVAGYVQFQAQGSLAVTALSHLIFYDAIGAFLSCIVDVLGNFEVWNRTSIKQPFGLERSEVVVGFAMSILLLFMGFDLISHGAGHYLSELPGDHEPHRPHKHDGRVTSMQIRTVVALAFISTLVSALMLRNHARMARSLRFGRFEFVPAVLRNPSHLLTLSCAFILLLMPILDETKYNYFDRALAFAVASAMCILGVLLVKTLGSMLLMSFPSKGASSDDEVAFLLREIESDTAVAGVTEAKFWQVHYGLCIATLKMRVRGSEDALLKLRDRVVVLVRTRLGSPAKGSMEAPHWEVSTQFEVEKD